MPQILYPPPRPQSIGEVLKTGAQIFRLSFNASLLYGIIIAVCGQLANLRNLSVDLPAQGFDSVDPIWWAWGVAGNILAMLFGSALLLRQKALAAGERTGVAAEMRQAAVLLSRLIVCVMLSTVLISMTLVPFAMVLPMAGVNATLTNLASANVGVLLLLIPLSLPAAWLSLGLFFAAPALVLRKLGPIEAMRVSFRLLRGNWWRMSVLSAAVLGVLLLIFLLLWTVTLAAVVVTGISDLKVITSLVEPLGIVFGAVIVPWCGAQVLAMMGDLAVRQEEARRAGPGGTA